MLSDRPSTSRGDCPAHSIADASSVMLTFDTKLSAKARCRAPRRNICGVNACQIRLRSTVSSTRPLLSARLRVSRAGTASRPPTGVLQQAGFAGLLQDNEFEQDEANQDFSDLDELLAQHSVNLTAKSRTAAHSSPESLLAIETGLFAGEPSYVLQRDPGGEKEARV